MGKGIRDEMARSFFRQWGSLSVAVVCATTGVAHAQDTTFAWNFNGNFTPVQQINGTATLNYFDATTQGIGEFGTTGGSVPNLPDGQASYYHQPTLPGGGNGGLAIDFVSGVGANGGGAFLNNYTFAIDVYIPTINWTPFFNTNDSQTNDADWYVSPDGALGIGELGYSNSNLIQASRWYRLVFVQDRTANLVSYYINGVQVFTGAAGGVDGRFSVYTSDHAGPDLLLFGEGDNSGNYTNNMYVANLLFADYAFSSTTVGLLGGPSARGFVLGGGSASVPEPGTALLALVGIGGMVVLRRRK